MTVWSVFGRTPLLESEVRVPAKVSAVDLSGLIWATPFDIAVLAATWVKLEEEGQRPDLILPEDPMVRAYLVDVGLDRVMPGKWGNGGGCVEDPPLIPLTRVAGPNDWDDFQDELWPIARSQLGDYHLARRTLYILGELVDNATTHGRSSVGAMVCAQRYTGATSQLPPGIWLGIADCGVGIPDHLRRNPRYTKIAEDTELIRRAPQKWVTGTSDHRGWGLVEVLDEAAESGPSEIVIRSGGGQGFFRLNPGSRGFRRYTPVDPLVPGTWIHIRVEGG